MTKNNEPEQGPTPPAPDDLNGFARAGRGGLFSRLGERINDALQNGRGGARHRPAVDEAIHVAADEGIPRRSRNASPRRMVIPEGVTVEGAITGASDTEVGGRIEGDLVVDGILYLFKASVVTGIVKAASCQADGVVEGRVEVTGDLSVGKSGRLLSDVIAGRNVDIAGQVNGGISTPGRLRMSAGSVVNGDVRVRVLYMEEGAALNGVCTMRAPGQNAPSAPSKEQTEL